MPLSYRVVFSTPWFEIEESVPSVSGEAPYYRMTGPDGVICLPLTPAGDILMVRQYRPSIDRTTTEVPAGGIDGAETVIQAAEREILEETACQCRQLVTLGHGRLYLSRNSHTEYFVLGLDAEPVAGAAIEAGIELAIMPRAKLRNLVMDDQIEQTAALSFLGLGSAKLGVDLLTDPIELIRQRALDYAGHDKRKTRDVR